MSTSIQVAYRNKMSKLLIFCNFSIDVKGVFLNVLVRQNRKLS
jgi:hypothetical protein